MDNEGINEKYTNEEALQRINQEGIGYAVQDYMRGESLADPIAAKLWDEAAEALNRLEKYLKENQ